MSKEYTSSGNGGKTFYNLGKGYFYKTVPEGTGGAIPRVVEKGKRAGETIYEAHCSAVSGMITGISYEVKDIGVAKLKRVVIDIDDDAQLQFNEMYLSNLMEKLPLVDFGAEVKIATWQTNGGKTAIDFYQNEEKIEANYYTDWEKGDNGWVPVTKNGIPAVEKDEDGDYDYRDRDKFLKRELKALADRVFGKEPAEDEPPF